MPDFKTTRSGSCASGDGWLDHAGGPGDPASIRRLESPDWSSALGNLCILIDKARAPAAMHLIAGTVVVDASICTEGCVRRFSTLPRAECGAMTLPRGRQAPERMLRWPCRRRGLGGSLVDVAVPVALAPVCVRNWSRGVRLCPGPPPSASDLSSYRFVAARDPGRGCPATMGLNSALRTVVTMQAVVDGDVLICPPPRELRASRARVALAATDLTVGAPFVPGPARGLLSGEPCAHRRAGTAAFATWSCAAEPSEQSWPRR